MTVCKKSGGPGTCFPRKLGVLERLKIAFLCILSEELYMYTCFCFPQRIRICVSFFVHNLRN